MSNDTRTVCQLPIGTPVMGRTGVRFTIEQIRWDKREVVIRYEDTGAQDNLHLEAPVYYDQWRRTWRMGEET